VAVTRLVTCKSGVIKCAVLPVSIITLERLGKLQGGPKGDWIIVGAVTNVLMMLLLLLFCLDSGSPPSQLLLVVTIVAGLAPFLFWLRDVVLINWHPPIMSKNVASSL
jgi:hypothetical protein